MSEEGAQTHDSPLAFEVSGLFSALTPRRCCPLFCPARSYMSNHHGKAEQLLAQVLCNLGTEVTRVPSRTGIEKCCPCSSIACGTLLTDQGVVRLRFTASLCGLPNRSLVLHSAERLNLVFQPPQGSRGLQPFAPRADRGEQQHCPCAAGGGRRRSLYQSPAEGAFSSLCHLF